METKNFKISIISEKRKEIMGVSILLIILFHSSFELSNYILNSIFVFFKDLAQIGVDIFLFLSGLGCYYSMYKDNNTLHFYKKRLLRIFPTYIICVFVRMVIEILLFNSHFIPLVIVYSLISFFVYNILSVWFISAIVTCYIFFPLIYSIILNKRQFFNFLLCLSLFIPLIVSIICKNFDIKVPVSNEIFFVRIPVFLFGVVCGKRINDKAIIKFQKYKVSIIFLMFMILILINKKFNPYKTLLFTRWLFNFVVPCLIVLIGYALKWVELKCNVVVSVLGYFGEITLELYLLHEFILNIICKFNYMPFWEGHFKIFIYNILAIIISVIFAKIININTHKLMNLFV